MIPGQEIPPVAASCVTPAGGSSAAAQGGEGLAPRSAEPTTSEQRAIRQIMAHARLAANAEANGDPDRRRRLIQQQGEILFAAGLQLMLEGDRK